LPDHYLRLAELHSSAVVPGPEERSSEFPKTAGKDACQKRRRYLTSENKQPEVHIAKYMTAEEQPKNSISVSTKLLDRNRETNLRRDQKACMEY
jgi:hypothetical protein